MQTIDVVFPNLKDTFTEARQARHAIGMLQAQMSADLQRYREGLAQANAPETARLEALLSEKRQAAIEVARAQIIEFVTQIWHGSAGPGTLVLLRFVTKGSNEYRFARLVDCIGGTLAIFMQYHGGLRIVNNEALIWSGYMLPFQTLMDIENAIPSDREIEDWRPGLVEVRSDPFTVVERKGIYDKVIGSMGPLFTAYDLFYLFGPEIVQFSTENPYKAYVQDNGVHPVQWYYLPTGRWALVHSSGYDNVCVGVTTEPTRVQRTDNSLSPWAILGERFYPKPKEKRYLKGKIAGDWRFMRVQKEK